MTGSSLFFFLFLVGILGILLLDLLVIGRKSHEVTLKEAAIWTAIWISLAFVFAAFLRVFGELIHGIDTADELHAVLHRYYPYIGSVQGSFEEGIILLRKNLAINFISGYLIEKTLSIDNLFVMMAILKAFSVRKEDYKRVLFWGIMGAILMRFIFIFTGSALISQFEWLLYIFGCYLLYAGVKMYLHRNKNGQMQPQDHPLVKVLSKWFRVLPQYEDNRFFVRKDSLLFLTPLFIVVVMIELSDLIFALDSIPAVFGITRDPYIVFFSNVFAILGLRSLFFLLIKVVERFHLLKVGVSVLLVFVGIKLIAHEWLAEIGYKPVISLYVIAGTLALSILFSVLFPKRIGQIE